MRSIVIKLIFELYLIVNLNIENMTTANLSISEIYDYALAPSSYRRISENEFSGIIWANVLASDENDIEDYYDVDIDLNDLLSFAVYKGFATDYLPTKEDLIIIVDEEPEVTFTSRDEVRDRINSRYRFSLKEFLEAIDIIEFYTAYFEDEHTAAKAGLALPF